MVASMNPNDNNGDSVPKLDPRTARSQLRAKVQGFGRALDRATSEGAAVLGAALVTMFIGVHLQLELRATQEGGIPPPEDAGRSSDSLSS